jgi:hypothetical protein
MRRYLVFFPSRERNYFCSSYQRSREIWISELEVEEEPRDEQAQGEREGVGAFYALMCFG